MRVNIVPPYDFHKSVGIFQRFSNQVVDYYHSSRYFRTLRQGDELCLVEVNGSGTANVPEIDLFIRSPLLSTDFLWVKHRIDWLLGAEFDLKPFYALMDQDPVTHLLKESLFGLKPTRSPDLFEALVIAITEQRVSLAAALSVRKNLAKKFGQSIYFANREYLEFPPPSALAAASVTDIGSSGLGERKAQTIKYLAESVVSGKLDLPLIFSMPAEAVIEKMTEIKGIGPWTVKYALSRGGGRYEKFLANDIALKAGLKKWYGADRIKSEKDIEEILDRFGQYSGYAAFYFIFSYAYDKYTPRLS